MFPHPVAARQPAPARLVHVSLALVLLLGPAPAEAGHPAERAAALHAQLVAAKLLAVELMRQGADRAMTDARLEAGARLDAKGQREHRVSAAHGAAGEAPRLRRASARGRATPTRTTGSGTRGERDAPAIPDDARTPRVGRRPAPRAGLVAPGGGDAIDTRINDPARDAPDAAQSEPSIAAWDRFALAAWNDGQGFVTGGDTQGSAWSADHGATWHSGGPPPRPAGWRWTSDPVLAVDERTGDFWLCALVITDVSTNGVAVTHARVSDHGVAWDPPVMARAEPNVSAYVDKPWIARDPAGGTLFLTHTCFRAGTDEIDLVRSSDGGRTWSAPVTLSSVTDAGLVQGSRVAVAPDGAVVAVWSAIGPDTDPDFLRLRVSRDGGASFGAEVTPAAFIANFGTGAPGYNRERGVHYPSLAVDRGAGPHRGRMYLAWSEAYDFYDDLFPDPVSAPAAIESEPDDTPSTATPFTPGMVLRGVTSSVTPPDPDDWAVTLAAGEKLIVWADSLPPRATYTLRLLAPAPDSAQRLCYGGDVTPGTNVTAAFYTFVAPVPGTYTLRFSPAYAETTSQVGGYRIRTLEGTAGAERGRDQRDVFVAWSDDGAAWSTPVRVDDDPVGYDDFLPEVAVADDGRPYVSWFDFRDDPSGSRTETAIARSNDGGVHWSVNARLAGAPGDFTASAANLAPDMGDYTALTASIGTLCAAWADARGASVDVWGALLPVGLALDGWPAEARVDPGAVLPLTLALTERSPLFGERCAPVLTDTRGWTLPVLSPTELTPGGGTTWPVVLAVPPDAAGPDTVTLTVRDEAGEPRLARTLALSLTGGGATTSPAPPFALDRPSPTPFGASTRIGFRLPVNGFTRLEVFAPRGERVRTLVAGTLDAGAHGMAWDGRDDAGRRMGAGLYFVRLECGGRTAVRRLVKL
ncbi:MAG: FlgD immunoglobulin-like domain containing protein [Candidatus Eisenbacteria bacterium]